MWKHPMNHDAEEVFHGGALLEVAGLVCHSV
eukprot:CAMPEP_0170576700 /NCGR_PEP_ID=MMETSP0224-20130122/4531_1 /TAXON_ID=285029 /ORGANISM="Togula jolla, Strain CCCM 725" /LENGTH=30 /DNA_ID= /DNA_START= /DNA_END= /DNA_ORIENTATION=